MNKYLKLTIITVFFCFIFMFIGSIINNHKLKEDIKIYDNNFKALNLENNRLSNEIIAYKFNTEQLEYINDSIINDLNNTRKELNIKDKQLKQMQSIKTEVVVKDSIFFKDTIFRGPLVKLDTIIGDEWYTVKLHLEYPNKINVQTSYTSDLSVFAYSSKEIIGTPKKCWLGRAFQKKQKVIRVETHDKNPNAKIKESKFIIIE